jgi:hypothetical protein
MTQVKGKIIKVFDFCLLSWYLVRSFYRHAVSDD